MIKELSNLILNEKQNDFENNFTIVFSGFNILNYLKLSVGSFLKLYPNFKNNIVIFDDLSTDGTKEWLNENNIKRITWSDKYAKQRDIHYSKFNKGNLIYRVGLIMNDIMEQINTKYLILSDGDVIFLKRFIEDYKKYFYEDYKVLYVKSNIGSEMFDNENNFKFKNYFFDEYKCLYSKDKKTFDRAHQYFTIVDLDFLKKENIFHDRVFNSAVELSQSVQPLISDTGLDFLSVLLNKKIKIKDLEYFLHPEKSPIFHFGFVSSLKRQEKDVLIKESIREIQFTLLKKHLTKDILNLIKEIDPNFRFE